MKIQTAVVTSDLNIAKHWLQKTQTDHIDTPHFGPYYSYWPWVKKMWQQVVGAETTMILINHQIPVEIKNYSENIILFKPIPEIPTPFQAQCLRLLYPALCTGDEAVIISDMDLTPLSREYFQDTIAQLPNDRFVTYRTEGLLRQGQVPICFNAATPAVWREIFQIQSWSDVRQTLKQWYQECGTYKIGKGRAGWCFDQQKLFQLLTQWGQKHRWVVLSDHQTRYRRLDYHLQDLLNPTDQTLQQVAVGNYTDFHMPMPYQSFRSVVDRYLQTRLDYLDKTQKSETTEPKKEET